MNNDAGSIEKVDQWLGYYVLMQKTINLADGVATIS